MTESMSSLRQDFETLKSVTRRVAATMARLEGKIDDISGRVATKDDLLTLDSRLCARIDGLAGRIADFDLRQAVQAGTLFDHDTRLRVLEAEAARRPALEKKKRPA